MSSQQKLFAILVALPLVSVFSPCGAFAQVIDFETVPVVGTPTEGLAISNQYQATAGVTFSLASGGSPVIAQVGCPATAFFGPPGSTGCDNPDGDQGVGSFFLTDDGVIPGPQSTLIISYDNPSAAASGVILDIDGSEQFLIEARDSSDAVLDSVTLSAGDAATGDGIATPWSFDLGSNVISSIRIQSLTTAGLAFDNFNATSAGGPETIPTLSEWGMILMIALLGLAGFYYLRRGQFSPM